MKTDVFQVNEYMQFTKHFVFFHYLHISSYMPCHFSHVPLSVTLWTIARQATMSMGFSRKNTEIGCHAFLRRSSLPRDQTYIFYISCIYRRVHYLLAPSRKPLHISRLNYKCSYASVSVPIQ